MLGRLALVGTVQAFLVGAVLAAAHSDPLEAHELVYVSPLLHYLRDSALATAPAVATLLAATALAARLPARWLGDPDRVRARVTWAVLGAIAFALAAAPAAAVHDQLFLAEHAGLSFLAHSLWEGLLAARWSFALLLMVAAAWGVPWTWSRSRQAAPC